jgi:hypothetical protein
MADIVEQLVFSGRPCRRNAGGTLYHWPPACKTRVLALGFRPLLLLRGRNQLAHHLLVLFRDTLEVGWRVVVGIVFVRVRIFFLLVVFFAFVFVARLILFRIFVVFFVVNVRIVRILGLSALFGARLH